MDITFQIDTEVVPDPESPEDSGVLKWQATLAVKLELGAVYTYRGFDNAKIEALRIAFQSFLSGEIYGREFRFTDVPIDRRPRIVIDDLPKEYQELILQLIDIKTGQDLISKLPLYGKIS